MTNSEPDGSINLKTLFQAEQARHGSKKALDSILVRYQCEVESWLRRLRVHSNDIDDLKQEVLQRILTGLPKAPDSFKGRAQFVKWVQTITQRVFIDTCRKHGRRREVSIDPEATDSAWGPGRETSPSWHARLAERTERIRALAMNPVDQDIIQMREHEGLDFEEIAQRLTRTYGRTATRDSVRMKYTRLLKRLDGNP